MSALDNEFVLSAAEFMLDCPAPEVKTAVSRRIGVIARGVF